MKHHEHLRRCRAAAEASPRASASTAEEQVRRLSDTLAALEAERDEAVRVAEKCAKTCVRLQDMVRLLEGMALDKVREGDEAAARKVLQEKAASSDVLERTNARAKANFELAARLANKVGALQSQLLQLLQEEPSLAAVAAQAVPRGKAAAGDVPGTPSTGTLEADAADAAGSGASYRVVDSGDHFSVGRPFESSSSFYSSSSNSDAAQAHSSSSAGGALSSSSSSAGGSGSSSYSGDSGGSTSFSSSDGGGAASGGFSSAGGAREVEFPWERSLREARDRVQQQQEEAQAAGRAAWSDARETIEEARARLRTSSHESIHEARSRLRQGAEESIAQARARIATQDAAVLANVRRVVDRYKRGEYVAEEELDWAFAQLERQVWRS